MKPNLPLNKNLGRNFSIPRAQIDLEILNLFQSLVIIHMSLLLKPHWKNILSANALLDRTLVVLSGNIFGAFVLSF